MPFGQADNVAGLIDKNPRPRKCLRPDFGIAAGRQRHRMCAVGFWTVPVLRDKHAGMNAKTPRSPASGDATAREDRLKAALKANMAKRKAQARARRSEAGTADKTGHETGHKDED